MRSKWRNYKPRVGKKKTCFDRLDLELQQKIVYGYHLKLSAVAVYKLVKDEHPKVKYQAVQRYRRLKLVPQFDPKIHDLTIIFARTFERRQLRLEAHPKLRNSTVRTGTVANRVIWKPERRSASKFFLRYEISQENRAKCPSRDEHFRRVFSAVSSLKKQSHH